MIIRKLYLFSYIAALAIAFPACKVNHALIAPPGTVKLNDTVYIDMYPVSNWSYLEFLSSLSGYWSLETSDSLKTLTPYGYTGRNFVSYGNNGRIGSGTDRRNKNVPFVITEKPFFGMPDSNLFQKMELIDALLFGEINTANYIYHPFYRNYPIMNISAEQAEMFCRWRSDMVKIVYATTNKDSLEYSKYVKIVKYRLPKETEWIKALEIANLNFSAPKNSVHRSTDPIVDLYTYYDKKDKYKFYSFPSYLSELIEDNRYINYNWTDSLNTFDTRIVRPFYSVSPGIGFRCACEVIK